MSRKKIVFPELPLSVKVGDVVEVKKSGDKKVVHGIDMSSSIGRIMMMMIVMPTIVA